MLSLNLYGQSETWQTAFKCCDRSSSYLVVFYSRVLNQPEGASEDEKAELEMVLCDNMRGGVILVNALYLYSTIFPK